ncbi:MAG: hypothetical protein ACP5D2_05325 [Candidatus Nanoarchaeia archaeon]
MDRSKYKPRPSVYVRAYSAIVKLYTQNQKRPLIFSEIERKLKQTPGIMFAEAVSLPSALDTLIAWDLLVKIENSVGSEEAIYIPCKRKNSR